MKSWLKVKLCQVGVGLNIVQNQSSENMSMLSLILQSDGIVMLVCVCLMSIFV